jgi:hypothetical protein
MASRLLSWVRPKTNPNSSQTSVTPILDLLEPLPQPHDRVVTGKLATPFLIFVAAIVVTENFSFLIVPFGFLVISFLTIAIHEFGHLLAGLCVGLRFRGVEIGPVSARRIKGKWSFRLRPRLYRGQAEMTLDRIRKVRRRLVVGILGGPVISYLIGIAAFVTGERFRMSDTFGWTTFLDFLGVFSVLTGIMSTIPFSASLGGNDAFLVRQLLGSKKTATPMIAALALNCVRRASPIIPEYHERWLRLVCAGAHPLVSSYYRDWNLYRNTEDPAAAAECLERLLKSSSPFDEEIRNHLIAEATYFAAWKRDNLAQARTWHQRIAHLEWLDCLAFSRLEIAILAAEKKYDDALAKCDATTAFLRENLRGPVSRETETWWFNWRNQIQEKMESDCLVEPYCT